MRDKTRRLLRDCAFPFKVIWVGIAIVIGYAGVLLLGLAYSMIGEIEQAKREFRERI